jgi:hypothetical protein
MRKLSKLSLLLCAIVGTLFGYAVTNAFIVEISIINFIIVEVIISVMHASFNRVKVKVI